MLQRSKLIGSILLLAMVLFTNLSCSAGTPELTDKVQPTTTTSNIIITNTGTSITPTTTPAGHTDIPVSTVRVVLAEAFTGDW